MKDRERNELEDLIQRITESPRDAELARKFLDGLEIAKQGGQFIVVPPYKGAPLVLISYSEALRQQLQPVIDLVTERGEQVDG